MTFEEWMLTILTQYTRTQKEWMRLAFESGKEIEREECAKICKTMADECRLRESVPAIYMMQAYDYAADAIRARGRLK